MVAIAFGLTTVGPFVRPGDACQMFTASFLVLLVSALFRWGSGRDAVIGSFFVVAKVAAASLAGSINGGELATGFAVMFAAATRLARTSATVLPASSRRHARSAPRMAWVNAQDRR